MDNSKQQSAQQLSVKQLSVKQPSVKQLSVKQQGVIIIYALVILLILGLIAATTLELLARQQQLVSNHELAFLEKLDGNNALLLCERQLETVFSGFQFHQQELPAHVQLRPPEYAAADAGSFLIDWRDESNWTANAINLELPQQNTVGSSNRAQCLFVLIATAADNSTLQSNVMADAERGARTRQLGSFHFRVFARLVDEENHVSSLLASDFFIFHSS